MRIMMQPAAISGAVAKPNSSAPSSAPMTTSRPVFRPPSTCRATRSRSPFEHQRLLGFGEADFPRAAGMLQRRERATHPCRRQSRTTVIVVGARLGNTGGDRADADFRDELDRDVGRRVDVLQVVDQLRQIFDRIDVMMRRRRNQPDAGRRMTGLGDRRITPCDPAAGRLRRALHPARP